MDNRSHHLLERYFDGTMDEQDLSRLEELLRTSPEARAQFRTLATVDAKLHEMAETAPDALLWASSGAQSPEGGAAGRRRSVWLQVLTTVAAIAIGVLIAVTWPWLAGGDGGGELANTLEKPADGQEAETPEPVAVLSSVVDAGWSQAEPPLFEGCLLAPGPLELTSGLAYIEFACGAMVVLEGPAHFELVSETRGVLHKGTLWARAASPVEEFFVDVPGAQVEDLGTEFGIRVEEQVEVHVIQGEVKVHLAEKRDDHQQDAVPSTIEGGRAVRFGSDTTLTAINAQPGSFVGYEKYVELEATKSKERHQQWQKHSLEFRSRSDMVAYYSFECADRSSRVLLNDGPEGRASDGALVGCPWAQGRWLEKQGLEFGTAISQVPIDIPGTWDSLSLVAWVRVDNLNDLKNVLLSSNRQQAENPGAVAPDSISSIPSWLEWSVSRDDRLCLSLTGPSASTPGEAISRSYRSKLEFHRADLGRWIHLATVVDRDAAQVTHYLDGTPTVARRLAGPSLLEIGRATIGNEYRVKEHRRGPRVLNGCIDELAIIGRALSDDEIRKMYEIGMP